MDFLALLKKVGFEKTELVGETGFNSSPKTKVNFNCHWDKDGLTISVKDSGVGIDPENLQQIYEPFYTQESRYHRKGTGLGMFIVKSIVDAHSGKIKHESEVGKGSIFEVCIPQQ